MPSPTPTARASCTVTSSPTTSCSATTARRSSSTGEPPRPAAREAVCLKAMARRAEPRYASAKELAEDIEHCLADEPVAAYQEPLRLRVARWRRRHPALVTGTAALVFTAVVALGVGAWLLS